jgi:hypothetical protein
MAANPSPPPVSDEILALISDDIKANRDRYLAIMREHGAMQPDAIIESLRETQDELLSIFRSATEKQALTKPAPDEWSLHELAVHALFTERLIAKLIHHAARGTVPSREDLEGAGIGMMPKGDDRSYSEVLDDLERKNRDLLDAVRDLPAEPNTEMRPPHPYFGSLNCREWAGFQRVHDLDHIQHSRKILAAIGA